MDGATTRLWRPVVERLQVGIRSHLERHPDEAFALLQHREETLKARFKALFYAPLFDIGKLSQFDYQEHPLETLLGRTYQSSTLNQFLGQLERIDAATGLMPALLPAQSGKIGYIDGHMIAFWTSGSMHKGKITNVGRLMAGSQAVITHDETGQALWAAYYPPDIRLPRVIVAYCEHVAQLTGIEMFVIDRVVNALEMARAFRDQGWGLLCMLDRNRVWKALTRASWAELHVERCGRAPVTAERRAQDRRGHFLLHPPSDLCHGDILCPCRCHRGVSVSGHQAVAVL
jgi:hypothetical protein